MLPRFVLTVAAITSAFYASPASAQQWHVRDKEAFVQSQARRSNLVIECVRDGAIWMRIEDPKQWQANQAVSIIVGGKTYPMQIDGGGDYVLLSDSPKGDLSAELLTALKRGGTLVLDGPAAKRMKKADRTFPLDGGAKAIAGVEKLCGR